MAERGEGVRNLASHGRRVWRWAAFDPPLRNPAVGSGCSRKVLCVACGASLGTTTDPLDALLIAWRHRRQRRSPSR